MNTRAFKTFLIIYKILFAGLGLWAIANEIIVLQSRGIFNGANFFSYFTIQSNVIIAVMLIVGAYTLIKGLKRRVIDALRGAATLYMGMTGIIFALLLSGLDPTILTAVPVDNVILHYIIPAVAILDWLLDAPKNVVRIRTAWLWLVYPFAYLIYTLVRGATVHWYPYPFLNVDTNGLSKVLVGCLIITIGVIIGGLIVRLWSWFVHRKTAPILL